MSNEKKVGVQKNPANTNLLILHLYFFIDNIKF